MCFSKTIGSIKDLFKGKSILSKKILPKESNSSAGHPTEGNHRSPSKKDNSICYLSLASHFTSSTGSENHISFRKSLVLAKTILNDIHTKKCQKKDFRPNPGPKAKNIIKRR